MKTRLFILSLLAACTLTLQAKPAYRGAIEKQQPDGSTITIYQHGDEFFHYMTTEDGTWVALQEDGFYRAIPALTDEQVKMRRQQSPRLRKTEQIQAAYPLNIAPKGIIVLVNFKDKKMQAANTQEAYYRMHNDANYKDNGAYGSVRQYFIDQSRGQYQPEFDVVGPVTVSKNMEYYGGNTKWNASLQAYDDAKVEDLVQEAAKLADGLGVDFSKYDHNNDGEVDFIYFIYAGYGEADSGIENTIWPHAYWLKDGYNINLQFDGKYINTYACGSELNASTNKRDGIATFCHEFSHVLGLPDLYTTNGANHKTMGEWDILDYGPYNDNGNTPPAYSAYERFFLGWLKPVVLNEASTVTLHDLPNHNVACLVAEKGTHNLIGNDPNPTTFFLLENRQQEGWDEFIPGHGLLITKVRYMERLWYQNSVNNTPTRMGVDIMEADGEAPAYALDQNGNLKDWGYFGKATDAFPAGATSYTPFDNYPITNIVETDGLITFDFMGGGEASVLDDVADVEVGNEVIVAIYNLLGQQQHTTDLNSLNSGIYIIKTNKSTKKVSIP